MSSVVFLFGNGLSIGVQPDLSVSSMTARLDSVLGTTLRSRLRELVFLAQPDAVQPLEARLGFEQLAGPLDRVANSIEALGTLARTMKDSECIADTYAFVRSRYLQVVGSVLRDITESAKLSEAGRWSTLNDFALAIRGLHAQHSATIFTLSYDTLLDSALIETRLGWFYDGFAGVDRTLNQPLDRWPTTLSVYHLHGSALWYRESSGIVRKVRTNDPLHEQLLAEWELGEDCTGFPVVILTDAKAPAVARHPISLFYQELWHELEDSETFVVAGYAFGDEPVNAIIRTWLKRRWAIPRRLEVWSHAPDRARGRFEQRMADIEHGGHPNVDVSFVDVSLPSSAAVEELTGRLART